MIFQETIITAFRSLLNNKLRTALTMLGIIIGVFSVVLLVSLVRGVQNYVTDQFNAIGSNLVFIMPGRSGISGDPAAAFTDNKLREKQVDDIKSATEAHVQYISPMITTGATAEYRNKKYYAAVNGVYANYLDMFIVEMERGEFFTNADNNAKRKIAYLGSDVKKELFGGKNPVGETIKIGSDNFTVGGFLKPKSHDFDPQIFVPLETVKQTMGIDDITYIMIKLENDANPDLSTKYIQNAMLKSLKRDDFSIMTQKDLLSSIQSILQILSFGLGAIAAISLLVGGIGIMNIMLVAVTERIKEIGLRKALGATPFFIGLQFLIEAVVLSLSGGLIGLLLGVTGSLIARNFIRTETPLWAVLLSLGFSLAVGVIFGTYPAIKASKKDPIEALRYE